MKTKKYFYEFLGFTIFYLVGGFIFGFNSTTICIIFGLIGAFFGKFISKVNGILLHEIFNHSILEDLDGRTRFMFQFMATYKTRKVYFICKYDAIEQLEESDLQFLIYNYFDESKYKEVLKNGMTKLNLKLKSDSVDFVIELIDV